MTPAVVYKDTRESLREQSIHCGRAIALDRPSFLLPNPPSTSVRTRVVLGVSGSPGDRLGSTCPRDFVGSTRSLASVSPSSCHVMANYHISLRRVLAAVSHLSSRRVLLLHMRRGL